MNKLFTSLSIASFSLASVVTSAATQVSCDAESGKKQFNKCIACHASEAGVTKMGPSLHGLLGRKVGTEPGYAFSFAMEQAGFEWTEQTLSDFLKAPMQYVPGTVMPFGGIKKDEQRDALVCYIKQLK